MVDRNLNRLVQTTANLRRFPYGPRPVSMQQVVNAGYVTAEFVAAELNAPNDGKQYARVYDSWEVVDVGTSTNSAPYRFQTGTAAPPGTGNVRFDNATPSATTNLFLSNVTGEGVDLGNLLGLMRAGDEVYLQDRTDSSIYQVFELTAPPTAGAIAPGGYHVLPVAWQEGAGAFSNNEALTITVISRGSGTGGGISEAPTDSKDYARNNAAWVALDWTTLDGKPSTFPPSLPIAQSDVTNLVSDLAAKAPLASPTFTGDPKAPTPATSDNDTSVATTAFVKAQGYQTTNATITLSGDISGSGSTAIAATLPVVNANVGTFQGLTVNAKGLVTAASNQSYLTANQTITLSGHLSGSGTTSINAQLVANAVGTTEIANSNVTYAKVQNVTASRLLGNPTGSAAAPAEISLGTGLSFAGSVLNATVGGGGTVTQVSAGAGITVTPSPITGSGSVALSTPVSIANGGTGATTAAAAPWVETAGDVMSGALQVKVNAGTPVTYPVTTHIYAAAPDASDTVIGLDTFGIGSPNLVFRRSRGTAGGPSAVQAGDILANFNGYGYGTSAYSSTARWAIQAVAAQTWTNTAQGTQLTFNTTLGGGTTGVQPLVLGGGAIFGGATGGDGGLGTVNAVDYRVNGTSMLTGRSASSKNSGLTTNTTSATGQMYGVNFQLTPRWSGRVLVTICATASNNTVGGACYLEGRYGTGTPPAQNAASAGSVFTNGLLFTEPVANYWHPFALTNVIIGLAAGTIYWFDVHIIVVSGQASVNNVCVSAVEV